MDPEISFKTTLKRVKRIMPRLEIRCQSKIKRHHRFKENEQYIQDNILNQDFTVKATNQAWLSDSTELSYGVHGENKVRLYAHGNCGS